jgi:hypothetical protein
MITTTVASVIERRLLVNYRIAPGFVAPLLPEPSHDGQVRLAVEAVPTGELPSELFGALDEAVDFFRHGALGFSPSGQGGCLDTVRLESTSWAARPMKVNRMTSSLFDDPAVFPPGTCVVDSALVMRNLPVQWVTELPPATDPRGRAA